MESHEDVASTDAASDPDAGKDAKPGELLLPTDFRLKFWVFALIYLVLGPGIVAMGGFDGLRGVAILVYFLFKVETLRLLHRSARLATSKHYKTTPLTTVIVLLLPFVGGIAYFLVLPAMARALRRRGAEFGLSFGPGLMLFGIVAAVFANLSGLAAALPDLRRAGDSIGMIDLVSTAAFAVYVFLLQARARDVARAFHGAARRTDRELEETFE